MTDKDKPMMTYEDICLWLELLAGFEPNIAFKIRDGQFDTDDVLSSLRNLKEAVSTLTDLLKGGE